MKEFISASLLRDGSSAFSKRACLVYHQRCKSTGGTQENAAAYLQSEASA